MKHQWRHPLLNIQKLLIYLLQKTMEVDDIQEDANKKASSIIGGILSRECGCLKEGEYNWFVMIAKSSTFGNFERLKTGCLWIKHTQH